jgi:4'-phosphopantetheinyl transferase EntD
MTASELDRMLEILPELATPAEIAGGFITDFQRGLMPDEAEIVASAVKKRRDEFEAGRCAARIALGRLGIAARPILHGGNGQPIWPDGIAGSITHSNDLCFAACSRTSSARAIGIDVERVGRMQRKLWRMVFSDMEQAILREMPDEAVAATVAFSAKEAFMKAQYAASGQIMGLKSMRVEFVRNGELVVSHDKNDAAFAAVLRECLLRYAAIGDHAVVFCAFPPES